MPECLRNENSRRVQYGRLDGAARRLDFRANKWRWRRRDERLPIGRVSYSCSVSRRFSGIDFRGTASSTRTYAYVYAYVRVRVHVHVHVHVHAYLRRRKTPRPTTNTEQVPTNLSAITYYT